jgi:hypothetical protein
MMADMASNLDDASEKVNHLAASVKEKEAKVASLEAEMKRRGAKGAELKRELEAARADLATVKSELQVAIHEKEQLVVELKTTKKALDVQKAETTIAKEDAVGSKWKGFVQAAQLEVCERGNRKKLGKCREAIAMTLTADLRSKFGHCLRSGQAVPSLGVAEKDEDLPRFAQYLNQEDRIVKDWYVLLCDPTLPEASGFASDMVLPPGTPSLVGDGEAETLGKPESEGLGDLLEGIGE